MDEGKAAAGGGLQDDHNELAVLRLAKLVEETTDLDSLYRGIHGIVSGLVPAAARSFIIARIDRGGGLIRPVHAVDARERFAAGPWPLGVGLSGYVASGGGPAFAYEDGVTNLPEGFELLGEKPAFWLGLPLKEGDEAIGVVIVQTYDHGEALTREDERGLASLRPHIAQAITRTELFRKSRLSLS